MKERQFTLITKAEQFGWKNQVRGLIRKSRRKMKGVYKLNIIHFVERRSAEPEPALQPKLLRTLPLITLGLIKGFACFLLQNGHFSKRQIIYI